MKNGKACWFLCALLFSLLAICQPALADDDDKPAGSQPADSRYGLFGLLDHRSIYGHDWFPEPFRVEDTDLQSELRFDWQHNQAPGRISNTLTFEIQKSFGIVTFELEAPYVFDNADEHGMGTPELSARFPLWQYVSPAGFFDNTFGVGLAVGVPTNSPISKNTELQPQIFDDLRLGEHFAIQSLAGYGWLLGPASDEASRSLEYQVAFGYVIEDEQFKIPHVERFTPTVELVGETAFGSSEFSNLTGTAGLRFELKPIAHLQPTLGVAYVFPIDKGARDQLHWGIITSIVFDF